MKEYALMFALVCALAPAAIYVLRPADALRLEGELAAMTQEDALALLDAASETTEFHDNLHLTHSDIALQAGRSDAARRALERASRQDDSAIFQDRLAEVARISGDLPAAILHSQQAHDMEPTAERRQVLGFWYRTEKDTEAEINLLLNESIDQLTAWEVTRLEQLLIKERRIADLEAVYVAAAERNGSDADIFRGRLVDFFIESGRVEDAVEVTLGWFRDSSPDPRPLEVAIPVLLGRGSVQEAYDVAQMSLPIAPATAHIVLPLFAASGHTGLALDLQAQWFAVQTRVSVDGWETLARLAAITGDLRGLRRALALSSPASVPEDALERALVQILRYAGPRALEAYRPYLTDEVLRQVPLIGAALTFQQGRPDVLRTYLEAAATENLGPWDRSIWVSLAAPLRGGSGWADFVARTASNGGPGAALAAEFISGRMPLPGG